MKSIGQLSAKLLCFELARLICNRLGVPSAEFPSRHEFSDGDIFVMYDPESCGGLQVSVKAAPLTFSIVAAGKVAELCSGGADRFLPLDAFSAQFLRPAAAVLCNSVLAEVAR